jgi:acyl-CoA thioester hydrolase
MAHRSTIEVRFNELDPYGHVNHSVYATYCEVARIEAMAAVGIEMVDLSDAGQQLVVTDLHLKFHAPAVGGNRLYIDTWMPTLRRASGLWNQRILRAENAELLLTAEIRACVTDRTGRPTKPTAKLMEAMQRLAPPPED